MDLVSGYNVHLLRPRTVAILSLLLPSIAGMALLVLVGEPAGQLFGLINFRLLAIPSSALDHYAAFFSSHSLTYFCQLSILKPIVDCPYTDPLSITMMKMYGLGNWNASLFATEGLASVGTFFAPISALGCGLVIALGNKTSCGLPGRFILLSSSAIAQVLLNVPLSTSLVTHGGLVLFLLWYVTPRDAVGETAPTDLPNLSKYLIRLRTPRSASVKRT